MSENYHVLTPANANPWYVLMTLYGEQDGEEVNWARHRENRAAWNAWSCQAMDDAELAAAAESSRVTVAELAAWPAMKVEVTTRHKAEMLRRNGEGFVYHGLPHVADTAHLVRVAFAQPLVMHSAVFSGETWFVSATFSGTAVFTCATFSGGGRFGAATFSGDALFGSASFCGDAEFGSAMFNGKARFISATFSGASGFGSARFSSDALFNSAIFNGDAGFRSVTFNGDAWFNSATFNGRAHFPEAKFSSPGKTQEARFIDSTFTKPTNFRDAIFQSRYPDFAGAALHEKTTFTDRPDLWPIGKQSDPLLAKASCATIRHNLGKQGLPEAEHFFFRREMGFAGQIGGWWERLPYRAFGVVSDYGYSILTPFLWLCLLIVGGGSVLAYGLTGSTHAVTFDQGLGLSFANVFNFLAFHKTFATETFMGNLPSGLKAFSGFQSIAGVVLLFFLGLGQRTLLRMR